MTKLGGKVYTGEMGMKWAQQFYFREEQTLNFKKEEEFLCYS